MNKRIVALLITGAVLLSTFAGCNDKKSESENTSNAAVTTPAEAGTKAPEESSGADSTDAPQESGNAEETTVSEA